MGVPTELTIHSVSLTIFGKMIHSKILRMCAITVLIAAIAFCFFPLWATHRGVTYDPQADKRHAFKAVEHSEWRTFGGLRLLTDSPDDGWRYSAASVTASVVLALLVGFGIISRTRR